MKRLLQSSFMLLLYSFLYIPIGILILNSFNESRLGFHWAGLLRSGTKIYLKIQIC